MNYDEMSDEDINERVSYYFPYLSYNWCNGDDYVWNELLNDEWDGCNNHNDWYGIAEQFNMTVDIDGKASVPKSKSNVDAVISHKCKNKIGRAVLVCFLKMKELEK